MNDRGHGESDVQRLRAEPEAMRSRLFRALQGGDAAPSSLAELMLAGRAAKIRQPLLVVFGRQDRR